MKYIEEAWKVLTMAGVDCIFENELPPDDHYKTTITPLESVPTLVWLRQNGMTASDV